MGAPRGKLSEKHWQAIKLLRAGFSRREVATRIGWSLDYFQDLCSGNVSKCGFTAELFHQELCN